MVSRNSHKLSAVGAVVKALAEETVKEDTVPGEVVTVPVSTFVMASR